jgi:hypothetical protein
MEKAWAWQVSHRERIGPDNWERAAADIAKLVPNKWPWVQRKVHAIARANGVEAFELASSEEQYRLRHAHNFV